MKRFFIFILFAAISQAFADTCQDIDKPPNPTSDCCGVHLANENLEIAGEAAINQFPWLALIEYKNEIFSCTGSLISSIHVLTAAHCTYSKQYRPEKVRLGVFNITDTGPDCVNIEGQQVCNDGAITIAIDTIKSHPEFEIHNPVQDISIIKLADKVPYNEFIRPICLPTSDVLVSPPDNLRLINAGWGKRPLSYSKDDIKHYVTLPYVDLKTCKELFKPVGNKKYRITDDHICAGGEKGLDTCQRDGGGPLMLKENGHYNLIGIVSFGASPCAREGIPSVYTRVYSHLPWINSAIAEL